MFQEQMYSDASTLWNNQWGNTQAASWMFSRSTDGGMDRRHWNDAWDKIKRKRREAKQNKEINRTWICFRANASVHLLSSNLLDPTRSPQLYFQEFIKLLKLWRHEKTAQTKVSVPKSWYCAIASASKVLARELLLEFSVHFTGELHNFRTLR